MTDRHDIVRTGPSPASDLTEAQLQMSTLLNTTFTGLTLEEITRS